MTSPARSLLAFLALRAVRGVEAVEGTVYRRALAGAVVAVDLAEVGVTASVAADPGSVGGWSGFVLPGDINPDHPVAGGRGRRGRGGAGVGGTGGG